MSFRDDFVWGAATASYQIEGAATEDGKGLSIWDQFCREPGAIKNGDTGAVACDHYHRYAADVALMKELELQAYRFSISWPRVVPEGMGAVNPVGLDFYDRLVDQLLQKGITPYVTLYHWDLPVALQRRGGWLNPDSSDWFNAYTRIIMERLSDRVRHWFTFNENKIFILHGNLRGWHAPGNHLQLGELLQMNHHVLLAHGKAVQTIRQYAKQPCQVGWVCAVGPKVPATASAVDVEAARRATFFAATADPWAESLWQDPVFLGDYAPEMYQVMGAAMPRVGADDFKTIAQPVDLLGLNIYFGEIVKAGPDGEPVTVDFPKGHPRTGFGWPVIPETLYWGPKFFYERYRRPIMLTENGLSCLDWVDLDGGVHDPQRVDFTRRYLRELKKAAEQGVDVRGYFHWSLLDNFEWADGFAQRFGLVHVDFETQQRTIKDSAYWYRDVIRSNGENL